MQCLESVCLHYLGSLTNLDRVVPECPRAQVPDTTSLPVLCRPRPSTRAQSRAVDGCCGVYLQELGRELGCNKKFLAMLIWRCQSSRRGRTLWATNWSGIFFPHAIIQALPSHPRFFHLIVKRLPQSRLEPVVRIRCHIIQESSISSSRKSFSLPLQDIPRTLTG